MKIIFTATAFASTLALAVAFGPGWAFAQDSSPSMKECVGENCPGQDMQGGGDQGTAGKRRMKDIEQGNQGEEPSGDQMVPRKKRVQGSQQDGDQTGDQIAPRKKRTQANQQDDVDIDVRAKVRADSDWKFDSSRHQRRRSKDATFRFYFGGYWYPQPYWDRPVYGFTAYRISCGEGRAIVAERFNRVRVVECRGGTYTYLGRRHGDTFRILLNSRTGRIVGRAAI